MLKLILIFFCAYILIIRPLAWIVFRLLSRFCMTYGYYKIGLLLGRNLGKYLGEYLSHKIHPVIIEYVIKHPRLENRILLYFDWIFYTYPKNIPWKYPIYKFRQPWKFRIYRILILAPERFNNVVKIVSMLMWLPKTIVIMIGLLELYIVGEIKYLYIFLPIVSLHWIFVICHNFATEYFMYYKVERESYKFGYFRRYNLYYRLPLKERLKYKKDDNEFDPRKCSWEVWRMIHTLEVSCGDFCMDEKEMWAKIKYKPLKIAKLKRLNRYYRYCKCSFDLWDCAKSEAWIKYYRSFMCIEILGGGWILYNLM